MIDDTQSILKKQVRATAWHLGELLHRQLGSRRRTNRTDAGGLQSQQNPRTRRIEGSNLASPPADGLHLSPVSTVTNPVLTARDVTDYGDVYFVADPFLIAGPDGAIHLFFEVFNPDKSPSAAIGHATSSDSGYTWTYNQIVLRESIHLSFPYVFQHDGSYYMVPDKWGDGHVGTIDLYRADSFPEKWTQVSTIIEPDRPLHDCAVFNWNDQWWGIAGDGTQLSVFYTSELEEDNWSPHSGNPVVTDRTRAGRPGGRPIVYSDEIVLFFQDCHSEYGSQVRAFRVEELSESAYEDAELESSPVLEPTDNLFGWNSGRMHHIDPLETQDGWLCAVDGNVNFKSGIFGKYHWSIGLYSPDSRESRGNT